METLQALLREAEADGEGLTWFRATSDAKDRHGTVIRAQGVDIGPFLRNPIVGWAHRAIRGGDPEDVLGRVESIERGADHLDVGIRFADHERAKLTQSLVRDGFLSSMSVGILPRKTGTEKINGQSVPVIRESELLEVSIVPVGSNPEAQKLLRDLMGKTPEEVKAMDPEEVTKAVETAIKPLGERLNAIEKTLDEPERKPAMGGARTTEDVDELAGKWLKARAFDDRRTLHEIAEKDPAPEAEVRDMLSANAYLPTQVSNRLITLVGERSKFLNRAGSISGSALSIQSPRESSKLTAGFVAENSNVIQGNGALDSVTQTAKSAWAGERVPNRVLQDQPVATAAMLLRQASDALASHFDDVFVLGTTSPAAIDVTSGLEDIVASVALNHTDAPIDVPATLTQIDGEYTALAEQARLSATWVINPTYASFLNTLVDGNGRPIFSVQNAPITPPFGEEREGGQLYGRPVIVDANVPADTVVFGDLARSMMVYRRQNIVAESSRDAEFTLDNTLFRFGWRFDVVIAEAGQVERFTA